MSVKATSWVWYECEVAGADRMVLLALADFADESGLCFGSWTTLEHKTKLSRSTIARSLTRLEKDGVLTKVQSSRTVGGRNLATVWKLPIGGDVTVTLGGCHNDTGGNVTMTPGGCHGDTPTNNNVKETIKGATPTASPRPPKKQSNSQPSSLFNPEGVPLPHGPRFAHVWREFCQHRKEIKAKLTPTAVGKILGDLGAVSEADAYDALAKSIRNGWRGVFLPDRPAAPVARGKIVSLPPSPGQSAWDRELAEIRRAAGE